MRIKPLRIPLSGRLDLYITLEILGAVFGTCVFVLFFLLMFQVLRVGEFLLSHGVSALILAKMSGLMIISFLPHALPLSFLIGLLIAFSRLSTDSEIIAIKAAGVSLIRLTAPIFLLAALTSLLQFQLNYNWVPWSVRTYKVIEEKIRNTKIASAIKEGAFTPGFFDMLIFTDKVDQKNNSLKRVFIYDEREPESPLVYVAKEAEILPMPTRQDLGSSIIFKLSNGAVHHSNLDQKTYEKIDFDDYQLFLKINEAGDPSVGNPQMIPQQELLRIIATSPPDSTSKRDHLGEYWRRNSLALSPLIFVFLGIGFGVFRQRTARVSGVLIGLLVAIFYWSIQVWGASAMTHDTVSPFLGMQAANIILFCLGIFSFRRASW